MREKRNNFERTRAGLQKEPKKKYFLVFEGEKTEDIYFSALINKRDELKIDSLINFIIIEKDLCEQHESNPKRIIDLILIKLEEINKEQVSNISLIHSVSRVLGSYIEDKYQQKLCRSYRNFFDNQIKYFNIEMENKNENIDEIQNEILTFLYALFDNEDKYKRLIDDNFIEIITQSQISYEKDYGDKICLFVDRDPQSFTEEQYDYVLETCKKNEFIFCISNPCFEFWLLLHSDKVSEYNTDLLENENNKQLKKFIKSKLKDNFGKYSKTNFDANSLVLNIHKAIENEKKYCENEEELKYNLGSNIGLLVNEWINK